MSDFLKAVQAWFTTLQPEVRLVLSILGGVAAAALIMAIRKHFAASTHAKARYFHEGRADAHEADNKRLVENVITPTVAKLTDAATKRAKTDGK